MTEFQMDEIMNNYRIEDLYDSKHYWISVSLRNCN